ncbi:type II secretion system F family protein [Minwuia thermotolerans]|uniref:Pilus assembly protein TadC n=1 Tax=Minwuia thermotolerans TaxID=2056226 RepID=A0A2M9G1X2_9PROT|nr:type II secretion system F family protein [Minwuia thermotolerans]PJK29709.1 pilus assembly protein TadC [Minwuia thermotolerans]
MSDYLANLAPGLDLRLLAVLLAALAAAVVAGVLSWEVAARRALAHRVRRVGNFEARLRERSRDAAGRPSGVRAMMRGQLRRGLLGIAQRLADRLRLLTSRDAEAVRLRLLRAGWHGREAMAVYYVAKLVLPLASAAVLILFLYLLETPRVPDPWRLLLALFATGSAVALPSLVLDRLVDRRQRNLGEALPDALDLMVICCEAGLGLNAAIDRVAREMIASSPAMAEELAMTAAEIRLLPERDQALDNLARRADFPAMQSVVQTLRQAARFGTPFARALRELAADLRNERMLRAEEKAARLPAILTVPMICFILPALFIVILTPAIFRLMDNL